jgi:hypothetical protein
MDDGASTAGTNAVTFALSLGAVGQTCAGVASRRLVDSDLAGDLKVRLDLRVTWKTEDQLLAEMAAWEPLPDEADPRWETASPGSDELWANTERLLAAADATGDRGWLRVAVSVFEHAADWDLHGAMQSIRHGPERAFMAVPDGIGTFARELEALSRHPRAGTRLWTVRELGILRQLSSLPHLLDRLEDQHPAVASEAINSLHMLAQNHPDAAIAVSRIADDQRD